MRTFSESIPLYQHSRALRPCSPEHVPVRFIMMDLARALRLYHSYPSSPRERTVAFVGAGGKTTAIFQLARILSTQTHSPVIVSATSHLGTWQVPLADHHLIPNEAGPLDELPASGVTLVTGPLDGDRTLPLRADLLDHLRGICSRRELYVLIEADGARRLPLKAPAPHEPPIPGFVDLVVVVAGLSALNRPLAAERVHRPERFAELSGLSIGDQVTPEALTRVLLHQEGGLKNIPPFARRSVLLNQADTPDSKAIGGSMAPSLLTAFDSVLVGSLNDASFQTFERTAGIILAAGESIRYGRPKQLLDWRGRPFVRLVAETALMAGLEPVILVTGAHAPQVSAAASDLPLHLAQNETWREGQASSIHTGLAALAAQARRGSIGSAIFLLVDQPQVGVPILQALKDSHTARLQPILAPLVMEQRANPVLFDRVTFPQLMQLHGDVGGRGIFDKFPVEYLPWHDERLLLDVDTPEQYERLLQDETL